MPERAILLSIKPRFANEIFEGRKKVELRRKRPNIKDKCIVFLYAASPVSAIVGAFRLNEVVIRSPQEMWSLVRDEAGLTKVHFKEYFCGASEAVGLFFSRAWRLTAPIELEKMRRSWPGFWPPQTFLYLVPWDGIEGLQLPVDSRSAKRIRYVPMSSCQDLRIPDKNAHLQCCM